ARPRRVAYADCKVVRAAAVREQLKADLVGAEALRPRHREAASEVHGRRVRRLARIAEGSDALFVGDGATPEQQIASAGRDERMIVTREEVPHPRLLRRAQQRGAACVSFTM